MEDKYSAVVSPINFTYIYRGHGCAEASISTDTTTYGMDLSYVLGDPLLALLQALVAVLRYGGEASCEWLYEPARDRWVLRRESDHLLITITGFAVPDRLVDWSELRFAARCDLWKFAAKVRLAASRLAPAEDQEWDPTSVQRTAEYQALCDFLEERKHAH
jgi:hypothetical protein